MAGLTEVIGLLYRADWTRLSLSAELGSLAERLNLLIEHDAHVQDRIAMLQAQRKHLQEKIAWYRDQLPATSYP